jgi:hypothetical protein
VGMPDPNVSAATFEAARQQAQLTFDELWTAFFSLGGTIGPRPLRLFLEGKGELQRPDRDMLAHALNERFNDMDLNHPVPYPT